MEFIFIGLVFLILIIVVVCVVVYNVIKAFIEFLHGGSKEKDVKQEEEKQPKPPSQPKEPKQTTNEVKNTNPFQIENSSNNKIRPLITNKDRRPGELQVYHKIKSEPEYGETISFSIKGSLLVPDQDYPVAFIFRLVDATNKDDLYPVLTNLDIFRADDDRVEYIIRDQMPHTESIFNNRFVFKIPVKFLEVPYSGERILRIFLAVINEDDSYDRPLNFVGKQCFAFDFEEFKVYFEGYGYLQHGDKLSDALCDIVGIASYVAQVDGEYSVDEEKVIQAFVDNRLENVANKSVVEEIKSNIKDRLKFMLNENNLDVFKKKMQNAVVRLKELEEFNLLTVAYELAVKTASIDNKIHETEQSTLNEIALLLGIDNKSKLDINDRYMKMEMFSRTNDEEFLGIISSMSIDEKKAHLNQEYNKWRNRVTSPNKAVASEANVRIEKIVKLRQKLKA